MADACFMARATTREHVHASIAKLALPTNAGGQYNHEDATTFITRIRRTLREIYNPGNPGNGMVKLCIATNAIARITSTSIATATTVLDEARRIAAAASAASTSGTIIAPAIDSRSDVQDEADRCNLTNQAVIGAKEGTTEAITAKVGSDVTDAVLRTANGSDFKSIDDWQLKEVIATVVQGADRPNTAEVLSHLLAIIRFSFDFRKKVSANMEPLCSKAGRMQSYEIAINVTQLVLVLLANIDLAASENWGHEFRPTLQSIRHKYAYNFTHTPTSINDILKELASADGVRKLTDAPPGGHTSAVMDQVSLLTWLLHQQPPESDGDVTEGASAALSDSE
jgi:hypothetical protein